MISVSDVQAAIAHLPESKKVSINFTEYVLLLVLDCLL